MLSQTARRPRGENIMFTSNNTSPDRFRDGREPRAGCILNLDDITLIDKVPQLARVDLLPLQPGSPPHRQRHHRQPEEAKYGVTHDQIIEAYRRARREGPSGSACTPCSPPTNSTTRTWCRPRPMLLELAEIARPRNSASASSSSISAAVWASPTGPRDRRSTSRAMARGDHGPVRRFPGSARLRPGTVHGERPLHDRTARGAGDHGHQPQGHLPRPISGSMPACRL